jgi:hypothetical protein
MIVFTSLALLLQIPLAASAPPQSGPAPIRMSVAMAEAFPLRWIGLRIELCGDREKRASGSVLLIDRAGDREDGIYLDEQVESKRSENGKACYAGVWRRTDGKSFEETVNGSQSVLVHGYNPEYILAVK